jgi:hypothetical protein
VCSLPPSLLDILIGSFLRDAKFVDKNGNERDYEPDSLTSLHRAIGRYLQENKYEVNIVTGKEFEKSRKILEAKRKELKGNGLGNKPNKAEALTPDEEQKLWDSGELNILGNGRVLQNTLFFFDCKNVGIQGFRRT